MLGFWTRVAGRTAVLRVVVVPHRIFLLGIIVTAMRFN